MLRGKNEQDSLARVAGVQEHATVPSFVLEGSRNVEAWGVRALLECARFFAGETTAGWLAGCGW